MLLEVLVALVVVFFSVSLYCKITAGRCTSTKSMAGKTVIITGATSGIGKETARDLLRRGARVIIACRNLERGAKVADELRADAGPTGEVVVRHIDTSDLASVRTFAKEVLDAEKAIHVLINNAGILGPRQRKVTADGLELTMATNHFGHFLLTNLLLGRLKESAPSRIVSVSSLVHKWAGERDLNDLGITNNYTCLHAYSLSKLCNVMFARELADRLAGTGQPADTMLLAWLIPVVVVAALVAVYVGMIVYCKITAGRCTSTRSMAGKTVIITGATAGIGKETARDLLRRGARVIIACRNMEKGAKVADELRADVGPTREVIIRSLDTSDLASVRTFAKEVLDAETAIHVLINNAGILAPDKRKETADGLELTMATNHFGHFLLTNLLLGRLKESAPSRIVNVSSLGHRFAGERDLNDLAVTKAYNSMRVYSLSKLCNVMFTRELADRLGGSGVTANSLHPGAVRSDLIGERKNIIGFYLAYYFMYYFLKDVESGAQTTIHLAVSEKVEGVTGRYFSDCKNASTSRVARNKDLATRLWEDSMKTVELQQHEC